LACQMGGQSSPNVLGVLLGGEFGEVCCPMWVGDPPRMCSRFLQAESP
jgi:hypothetical protein